LIAYVVCIDCTPQWLTLNDTSALGAKYYFNVSSEQECQKNCTSDRNCVAVDVNKYQYPIQCWPHFDSNELLASNLYDQRGTTLLIPVKRCIASFYCKLAFYRRHFPLPRFFILAIFEIEFHYGKIGKKI